jgi:hypothetical protein
MLGFPTEPAAACTLPVGVIVPVTASPVELIAARATPLVAKPIAFAALE